MAPKRAGLARVATDIDPLIAQVRGQRVILDADLAAIYGVPTKALNQAVKRNTTRFPQDFVFRLTIEEVEALNRSPIVPGSGLRSQFVTSNKRRGGRRYLPYAFTEHGAIMAANVLNSPRAVQMSVFVVRAFIKMRAALNDTRDLALKLAAVETEIKSRLDVHEAAIVDILQRIMRILEPPASPPPPPEPPKTEIGFHVREDAAPYRVRKGAANTARGGRP